MVLSGPRGGSCIKCTIFLIGSPSLEFEGRFVCCRRAIAACTEPLLIQKPRLLVIRQFGKYFSYDRGTFYQRLGALLRAILRVLLNFWAEVFAKLMLLVKVERNWFFESDELFPLLEALEMIEMLLLIRAGPWA